MSSVPSQPDSTPPAPAPAAKATKAAKASKPRKKHWILRIIVTLVIIALLLGLVVQIVLWTDLPRGIVVKQIEGQLGLRLSVKSLTTGWLGNTQLNDVTIGLPLSDKAFLEVPVMKVKNTSLFGLIIGRPVEVRAIELDQPHLYVVQNQAGQWNLQQVAELLARAGGKKSGEESAATSSRPQMPNVHLVDGTISIIDNKSRSLDISPLKVDGYSDSAVSWKYDVDVPSKLSITGRLVPGGNWGHEVALKLQDIGEWARPWDKDFPKVALDLEWHGELSNAGVGGRLDVKKATVDRKAGLLEAYGSATIAAGGDGVSIHPDNLLLKTGIHAVPDVTLASGTIAFDPTAKTVKADQLLVSVFGGAVKVGASYDLNTSAADIEVLWNRLSGGKDIIHSGGLKVTLRKPFPDKIVAAGHLTSAGNRGPGQWLASVDFNATGRSFTNFDWTVRAPQLQWQRYVQGINLDGLAMTGAMRDDSITLTSIGLPNKERLSGRAGYSLNAKQPWELHLTGQRWPFKLIPGTEVGFALDAEGDNSHIKITNAELKSPDVVISINADYVFSRPKPLMLNLSIVNAPPQEVPVAVAASNQAKVFNGTIDGHFSVEGTVQPLKLDLLGELDGREIDVRGHHVGNINLGMAKQSHIDENGVFVYTDALALFGGTWNIDGVYVPDFNDLTINVGMKGVELRNLAAVADQQDISGSIDGDLHVSIPHLDFSPGNIHVPPASFMLKKLNVKGALIDEIDATLWMQHGELAIDPIHAKRAEGTADMSLKMDLSNFRQIKSKVKIVTWPIDIEGAVAHINASLDIPSAIIDLPNAAARDPAQRELRVTAPQIGFLGTTTLKGEKLGDLVAYAGIDGRELDVRGVHMQMLGGRLDGQAHADLNEPLKSTAEFTWENLDLKKFALIFPQLNELKGQMAGDLRVAPTSVPRPREPLAMVLTNRIENGAWRTVPIKDMRLAAYFGPNEKQFGGGWRMVMEDSKLDPSFVHLANGTLELWGRTAFGGRATSSQAQVTFRDIDLNIMVHAGDPTAAQMPGSVAGSLMLIRVPPPPNPAHMPTENMFPGRVASVITPIPVAGPNDPPLKQLIEPIYAEGQVKLTKTNLAKFGPFAFIYNLGKLFQNVSTPTGFGNLEFHLERGALSIEQMHYFNSGTEIRAVATVKDVWNGKDSPLAGTIALVGKPLSSVKLPFFADLNEAFTAIQKSLNLTAVRVTGTLGKPHPQQLGVSELGQQMRTLLVKDAKGTGSQ
ncbi:MAG TPA: hypothetical protein VFE47_23650 [Tepidisphaeraceae bacterium]|jgi:uncharacterized protein involved in outer membrane biogenesis|nr:hypothetical protein [Tepidisphaeraceae bacterium]